MRCSKSNDGDEEVFHVRRSKKISDSTIGGGPPTLPMSHVRGGVQPNDADVKLHHFPRDRGEKKKISEATM